jgi:hypothetical protein
MSNNLKVLVKCQLVQTTRFNSSDKFSPWDRLQRVEEEQMKVTIKHWHAIAQWHWNVGKESSEQDADDLDDLCGICRVPYDGCCPACKVPGDDCPLSK